MALYTEVPPSGKFAEAPGQWQMLSMIRSPDGAEAAVLVICDTKAELMRAALGAVPDAALRFLSSEG